MESKHNLLMKFGQFMSYSKINNFIKKFYKNCSLKTSSRHPFVCKEGSTISIGKFLKEVTYIRYVIANLSTFSPNQHAGLLRFFFPEHSLKIKKGLEIESRPHFSCNFLIKKFVVLHKLAKFHYQTVFTSQVIQ